MTTRALAAALEALEAVDVSQPVCNRRDLDEQRNLPSTGCAETAAHVTTITTTHAHLGLGLIGGHTLVGARLLGYNLGRGFVSAWLGDHLLLVRRLALPNLRQAVKHLGGS